MDWEAPLELEVEVKEIKVKVEVKDNTQIREIREIRR